MKVLAIDIGGTMIKYGLVSQSGKVLLSKEIPTESGKGLESILRKIDFIFNEYREEEIIGIGVSATGQINGDIGKIIGGNPIIPNWIGTNLVEILEEKYSLPVILENDVNCAALGEKWKGAGKNSKSFICLTIGTGIGGGIILNNELFRGEGYIAGEFGHIPISVGEYEQFASTTALVRMVKERTGKVLNGKEIFEFEKQGLKVYTEIIDEWVEYIIEGLLSIIYIFNPSSIILGGGVTKQGSYLLEKLEKSLERKIFKSFKDILKINFAELGNDAGMLGASYLLLKKLNKIGD